MDLYFPLCTYIATNKHICETRKNTLYYIRERWYLMFGGKFIEVSYCPYCGLNLKELTT